MIDKDTGVAINPEFARYLRESAAKQSGNRSFSLFKTGRGAPPPGYGNRPSPEPEVKEPDLSRIHPQIRRGQK